MSAVPAAAPARPQAGCEQPLQAASPTSLPAAIPPDNGSPPPQQIRNTARRTELLVWESPGKRKGLGDVKQWNGVCVFFKQLWLLESR